MKPKAPAQRFWIPFITSLTVLICFSSGCGPILSAVNTPLHWISGGSPRQTRQARKAIGRAIQAHKGVRVWKSHGGRELEVTWTDYRIPGQPDKSPARIMMTLGPEPRIHIHYTRQDQVFAYGDEGPWSMYRSKPDRDEELIARAAYSTKMMAFFLSVPYILTDRRLEVQGLGAARWGGKDFDVVSIGFRDDSLLWPDDKLAVWIDRATGLVDRFFFVSTGKGSAFGDETPNYVWILWSNYKPVDGIQVAHNWSFIRADEQATQKEKVLDLEIGNAVGNRSFLPVLFREPIIQVDTRTVPEIGGRGRTPAIAPKLAP